MVVSALHQVYRSTLAKYHKFKRRLDRHIDQNSLSGLSPKHKNRLLRVLDRLKRRLANLELQLKLGVSAAGACLVLGIPQAGLTQNPVPTGSEFQVNTYTMEAQADPSVAIDSDGDFVVVWQSNGQDGYGYGVYGQRYNASGGPLGSEFGVNSYTDYDQMYPNVASDADGDFVVIWESVNQDGDSRGIYGQRFNAAGEILDSEFQVNTNTSSIQWLSDVAMDSDGDFVVVWESYVGEGTAFDVYGQRFNANGTKAGSEFQVNSHTTGDQVWSRVASASNGDFVVVWGSDGQDGSGWGVYGQRYNADGTKAGSEFKVNTTTNDDQWYPAVAMGGGGDFVVAWDSNGQDGSEYGVYARRYNSSGTAVGGEFPVNTYTTGTQWLSSVQIDGQGNFVIAWSSDNQDGSGFGIFARRFDAGGTALGSEFQINTYTAMDQTFSSTAVAPDGDMVVAWESDGQDGSANGVFAQRFRLPCDAPDNLVTSNLIDVSTDLNWDVVVPAQSYDLRFKEPGGAVWSTISAMTNTTFLSRLDRQTQYVWQVKTRCEAESSVWTPLESFTTTAEPCAVPANPVTSGINATQATFSWDDNTDRVSFDVRHKVAAAATWSTANTDQTSHMATGLTSEYGHVWQVRSVCETRVSDWAALQSFTTGSCTTPSGLNETNITTTSADLSWGLVQGSTGYKIRYKEQSGATWTTANTPATAVNVSGLTTSGTYVWQVRSTCLATASDWSGLRTLNLTAESCTVPTNLDATNIDDQGADLGWDAVGDAASYKLRYKRVGDGSFTKLTPGTHSASLSGLDPFTNYHYQVRSVCATTQSGWSPLYNFTTTMAPTRMGFGDVSFNELILYPNPSQGRLTVRYTPETLADLQVYDPVGRLVFSRMNLDNIDLTLNLAEFGRGMYLVRVTEGSEVMISKVLVD